MDKIELKEKLHKIFLLSFVTIMVPMPWFVISFYHTNNPFYPLFTHLMLRNSLIDLLNPIFFLKTIFQTLLFAPDPINPFYLISIPLIIIYSKKLFKKYKILLIYSALTFMIWYLTSQSGGTRFLSSYLPAYTVLGLLAFKELKSKISVNFLLIITFFTILTSIVYRGVANSKNLPVIIGIQSKQDFLMKNLNFSFGDFYDENDEIKKLVGKNLVLIHGIHNLYYVDFNYTISEWDNFKEAKFLLMQSGELPKEYKNANLIYSNPKTKVKLYKL